MYSFPIFYTEEEIWHMDSPTLISMLLLLLFLIIVDLQDCVSFKCTAK